VNIAKDRLPAMMLRLCCCLTLALASAGKGAEGDRATIEDFDFAFFDASGQLVRRLRAASATGLLDVALKKGVADFFGPEGAERVKIGTLLFDEATFHRRTEVVESDGPMDLIVPAGTISAIGFRYEMKTGRLFLMSAVIMKVPEALIAGREAEIVLTESPASRDLLLSRAEIKGDVVVAEIKIKGVDLDRIETPLVVYTGSENLLEISVPLKAWSKGEEIRGTKGAISYRLARPLAPLRRSAASPSDEAKK
jgi:hypothetical protein